MSDQFYSYLTEKIITYFRNNPLRPGDKYYIQFENNTQVGELYSELKDNIISEPFSYCDNLRNVEYKTYMLDFGRIKLIVASTYEKVHPDFLTTLRNMVGIEEGYLDKAILFIHNSTLDSILGGTGSFHKEGMPFHIKTIENDIKRKLEESSFSDVDRAILRMYMNVKKDELIGGNPSVFEYREMLSVLEGSSIDLNEYNNFGLFPDNKLGGLKGKELDRKLEENAKNYSRVAEIHNYGLSDTQLEKYYDEKGVERLKRDDWGSTQYKDVEKYIEDKKNKTVIEFIPNIHLPNVWDREEGSSKTKSRIRNILVFRKTEQEEIVIEFCFTDYVKTANIENSDFADCVAAGKKLITRLKNISSNTNFHYVKYRDDSIVFEFRIAIINCQKKYLESIRTNYSVITKGKNSGNYILINSDDSELIFNEFEEKEQNIKLIDKDQLIYVDDDKLILSIDDSYPYSDESEMVYFRLCINNCVIPFEKAGRVEKPKVIDGLKLWKLKRDFQTNFEYTGENKLQHGTKCYFTRDEFRKNLELEQEFIKKGWFALFETTNGLEKLNINVSKKVESAFTRILNYFRNNKCLPSLAYLNEDLKKLYSDFLKEYIEELNDVVDGGYLEAFQKDLFYIGMVKRNIEDKEILLTPLHPLNIAYQLHVSNIDTSVISDNEMELLRKFQHLYLLPYININPETKEKCTYIPIEQNHSAEWKVYVDESLPRYKGSKDYVSKLVSEKIEEFVDHFQYLFSLGDQAPIVINLVNTGDSKEILQGIFRYYVKSLRNTKNHFVIPMIINVYADKNITNAFEEFAAIDDAQAIKEMFHLDLNVEDMNEEDVIDLYREKVNFYSKDFDRGMDYAHITFIEMMDDSQLISTSMEDIPSGVVLNSIISGTPSVLLGETYRTGFGTKYAKKESNLMTVAIKLNSLNAAINGNQYFNSSCFAVSISRKNQNDLDKVYDASNWVTFINPKVDLSYFKNDPGAKDLIIIHYSDQYNTTSSGYDAITVTRKSKQYQNVIEEYLEKNGVTDAKEKSPDVINMFNAINGDWLLRLLSNKSYFPKEKLSILSAIKYAVKKFAMNNTIWVSVSLEEVLRVSGGVGLRKKDGLFSAKNLGFENGGATSDDVLLIGIRNEEQIQVTFYPIEVKIGKNAPDYIEKGIEQAKQTRDIFRKTLQLDTGTKNFKQALYRNFFMQLAVSSAEKLLLYDIGDGKQGWEQVTDSDLRRKLLNEEYEIVESLNSEMGEACVLSFKKDCMGEKEYCFKNVLVLEKPEILGINLITKSFGQIDVDQMPVKNQIDINIVENTKHVVDNKSVTDSSKDPSGNDIKRDTDIIYQKPANEHAVDTEDTEKKAIEDNSDRNMEILFGTMQDTNKPLLWYPNDSSKVLHTNTGIIGTMGSGKTQFTKSLVTQIYRESKYNLDSKGIGILIFDYKGDYNNTKKDFIDATNAKVYSLCDLPFNPLSLTLTDNPKPMLPLHTANSLKETIAKAFGLGIKQETLLRDMIMEAYTRFGILKNDITTWNKQAPTLADVFNIYINRDDLKEDSLYAAFSNLIDFQIFEPDGSKTKGLYEFIEGVTVIDLSGFDSGIQNLVVAITLDLFYSQMQGYGHSKIYGDLRQINKIILVDEADNFLSKDFAALKRILKEGREFGVGTILSTQLLSHFSTGDNEYANYILTWVIHNVADLSVKDIKYIFNTQSKSEEEYLFSKIKQLQKHFSVVKMGDKNYPIVMRDKAFWELVKK